MRRLLKLLLPPSFFFADDRLTVSAKRLIARLSVAGLAFGGLAAALGLLDSTNWRDVASGALIAWAASAAVWTVTSYKSGRDDISASLVGLAERDLLHARLNQLAHQCGAPLINLVDGQLQDVLAVREERHAHLSGLEEFRSPASDRGWSWWDNLAVGDPSAEQPK